MDITPQSWLFALAVTAILGIVVVSVFAATLVWACRCLRANRSRPYYPLAWSCLLASCIIWLVIFMVTSRGQIHHLLMTVTRHPTAILLEWPLIPWFAVRLWPVPIALACVGVSFDRWWNSRSVQVVFLSAIGLLILLHGKSHRYCTLRIVDQFGQPVPEVVLTYFVDGSPMQKTAGNGDVRIPYYRSFQRPSVANASAVGYEIDSRLCSIKFGRPIPDVALLPAWKVVGQSELLLSEPHANIVTDGRPYYVNLLRGTAGETADPWADLEIRVDAPLQPPQSSAWRSRDDPFPWKLRVRVLHGGWAPAPEPGYCFLAPENDYQASFAREFLPAGQQWRNGCSEKLYLKLRDGRVFAAAKIAVACLRHPDSMFGIHATVNPAANRNLYGGLHRFIEPDTGLWLRGLFGDTY